MQQPKLYRKSISLTNGKAQPVDLPLLTALDGYQFLIEHESPIPLQLTFTFFNSDNHTLYVYANDEVQNSVPFYIDYSDTERNTYDKIEIKSSNNENLTINLTINETAKTAFTNP